MNRDWRLLLTASTISTLGDGAFLAVLPLLAANITTDPRLIAGVTAFGTLPWLLFSLPVGALVDRADPRRSLLRTQLAQAALVTVLAAATMAHTMSMALIYAVAFALGAAETVAKVAIQKLIPSVVPGELLEKANGRQNASMFSAKEFLGPPLGALLFSFAAALPLWADVATFAISAALVARLSRRPHPTGHSGRSIRAEVADGVRWLARHRLLRTLTLLSGAANLANYMALSTLVLFATSRLGLSGRGYGLLVGLMAAGGIAGSLLSARLVARFGGRAVVTTTIFTTPTAMLAIATLARDLPTMAALATFTSFGASLWNVASASLRQRTVPLELAGRVSSTGLLVTFGAQPIGAILGGLLAASPLGLTAPWLAAATLRLTAALLALPALRTWPTTLSSPINNTPASPPPNTPEPAAR
ncbi:MFS transporter [Rhizocola hellebori]|uniref:MFS transporter n=1 Tax=Rhizocola hellebori TaxID=1392758 RepID=A0A8J3VN21_9ACTN|nr:MFS transporter [Rhizocola hellebori]GIH11743.1 MFS transporter [Rhizocola hellebori]